MAFRSRFSKSNGTTVVTICDAPAASTSRTIGAGCINIMNLDTASITVYLQINNEVVDESSSSDSESGYDPNKVVQDIITINAGESWSNDKQILCLDSTTRTLEIYLSGAVSLAEADISVVYRDELQA